MSGILERLDAWGIPVRQAAIAGAAVIAVLVATSFVRVAIAEYQVNLQKQTLQREVDGLEAQNAQLREQIAYLQTDAGVEQLARDELGWTRPGEIPVVVIDQPSATPTPTTDVIADVNNVDEAPPSPNYVRWWKLFVGR